MKIKILILIFLLIGVIFNSSAQTYNLSLQTAQISSWYDKISIFIFGEQISVVEILVFIALLVLLYILFSRPLYSFSTFSESTSKLIAFLLVVIILVVSRVPIRSFVKSLINIAESFFGFFGAIGVLIILFGIGILLLKVFRLFRKSRALLEKEKKEKGEHFLRVFGEKISKK
jgi:hypothetical protein